MIQRRMQGDIAIYKYTISSVMPSSPDAGALPDIKLSKKVIVDLDGVDFISSTVLGTWLSAHKILEDVGGCLVICGATQSIYEILEITKLDQIFRVFPNLEKAVQSFS
jgi:anti-sigma B factor antagonist